MNSVAGEYYHVFNRGVDKRTIFEDRLDADRFMQSIIAFNFTEPTGSIYEKFYSKKKKPDKRLWEGNESRLVSFVCYAILPNHYHFLLTPLVDGGLEKFMQKLGNGYTKYFNEKHKRSGVLFQGKYKSVLIENNEQLLHTSAYINLNIKVHPKFGHRMSKLGLSSSWDEYLKNVRGICDRDLILGQYKNPQEYIKMCRETIQAVSQRRILAARIIE
jgi:hypothetical protein